MKNQPKLHQRLNEIRLLISRAKIDKAIQSISDLTKSLSEDFNNKIIVLSNRYNDINQQKITNSISPDDYQPEFNRIVDNIIQLLSEIEMNAPDLEGINSSSKEKQKIRLEFSSSQANFLRSLIAKDNINELLQLILDLTEKNSLSNIDDFILLSAQHAKNREENMNGTISSEDLDLRRNRLRSALLSTISELENETVINPFGLDEIIEEKYDKAIKEAIIKINKVVTEGGKKLDLSNLGLKKIPRQIVRLVQLEELNLSNNQIEQIEHLTTLIQLRSVDLSNNNLLKISGLKHLTLLEKILLKENHLTEIQGLEGLKNLNHLDLSQNQIKKIEQIAHLSSLEVLCLGSNQISRLENLDELSKLTYLLLGENNISDVKNLKELNSLTLLELSKNPLKSFKNLDSQLNLKHLYLAKCEIKTIKNIRKSFQLETLVLSNNSIQSIKPLTVLTNLKHLRLSQNKISDVSSLSELSSLNKLLLDHNKIDQKSILENQFQDFLLSKNEETFFLKINDNPFLSQVKGLKILDYQNEQDENHLELLLSDIKNLMKKKDKALKMQKIKLPNKIVLIGNSNAGKTSLNDFLCKGTLQTEKERKSTDILEIRKWKPRGKPEFIIYDFGGQDFYHATYQMFLSKEATYIILWTKENNSNQLKSLKSKYRPEDFFCFDVNYWLGNIRFINNAISHETNTKGTPENSNWFKHLVLVENKIDKPANQIGVLGMDHDFGEFERFKISLLKGGNELNRKRRNWLKDYLLELHPTYSEEIPLRARAIKDYLSIWEGLRLTQNRWYIFELQAHLKEKFKSWSRLAQIDIERILKRFNKGGLLLWYPHDKTLKEFVWIDPVKLQSEVLSFLNGIISIEQKGKIPAELLEGDHFSDKISEPLRMLLLKNQILFKDDFNGIPYYILPQKLELYPEKDPVFQIATEDLPIAFTIRFKQFMPMGIMNRLIAIFSKESSNKFYSRYKLVFTLKEKKTEKKERILLECDLKQLFIRVSMHSTSDYLRKKIFDYIIRAYHRLEEEGETPSNTSIIEDIKKDSSTDFMQNLIDNFSLVTKEALGIQITSKDRFEKTRTSPHEGEEIFTKLVPPDLEIAFKDNYYVRYRELLQAQKNKLSVISGRYNEKKTKNIKTYHFNVFMEKPFPKPKKVFISYSHDDIAYRQQLQKFLVTLTRDNLIDIWQDEMIQVGSNWDESIRKNLDESDIIILLISQNFIASQYIYNVELKEALKKHFQKDTIFPIIIESCDYKHFTAYIDNQATNLASLQFLPQDQDKRLKPVREWDLPSKAWKQITERLRDKIKKDEY